VQYWAPDIMLKVCKDETEVALISLALYSGARQSELLGLRWSDVDWDGPSVTIAGQITRRHEWTERTKSKKRTIWIPAPVACNLKALWLRSLFKEPEHFVFASTATTSRSQEWARRMWRNVRDRTKISGSVRFHDLRHTFASILIGHGATPVELAEQLGDTVPVAMATYAGLFDRARSEAKIRRILEANYPHAVDTE
jgi:integrase